MRTAYQIWTNFLVFFVAVTLAPGVTVRNSLEGYIVSGGIYVALMLLLPKIIEFIKLNVNFTSFFLIGALVSFGYFNLMRYILIGFLSFDAYLSPHGLFGLNLFSSMSISQVVLFASMFTITLTAFHQWLMEK